MTRYAPQWLQVPTYSAAKDRELIGAMFPGVGVEGMKVTPNSGMVLNISAGHCAIPSPNGTGSVVCTSDAVDTVTIGAAPGGGNSRIDLVTAKARGNDLDGGANNDFIFVVVPGTASGSPTAPALPAASALLAQVLVGSGVSSISAGNITDMRAGFLMGGVFETFTERDAALPEPGIGQLNVIKNVFGPFGLYQYVGPTDGWQRPWNLPWGELSYTQITASVTGITAEADVSGLDTGTFALVANRQIEVTVELILKETTSGIGSDKAFIFETTPGNTKRQSAYSNLQGPDPQVASRLTVNMVYRFTSVAGNYRFKARASSVGGSVDVVAGSGGDPGPAFISVKDCGPAGPPA